MQAPYICEFQNIAIIFKCQENWIMHLHKLTNPSGQARWVWSNLPYGVQWVWWCGKDPDLRSATHAPQSIEGKSWVIGNKQLEEAVSTRRLLWCPQLLTCGSGCVGWARQSHLVDVSSRQARCLANNIFFKNILASGVREYMCFIPSVHCLMELSWPETSLRSPVKTAAVRRRIPRCTEGTISAQTCNVDS
jgi:hypothetical protein